MSHDQPSAPESIAELGKDVLRQAEAVSTEPKSARITSLDAFRGITIALMVLVNAGSENIYSQLQHAEWHGWTVADVIFPSFLWIVGVSITLSLRKRRRLASGVNLTRQIAQRALILFVLGLIVYAVPRFDLGTQRVLGVLQRIAICYLVGALLYIKTTLRTQMACAACVLAAYWAFMAFAPVPGFGAGNLTVEGNFAHYVDRIVLGAHNYAETKTWDPEGIVSTLPSIATLLFGILAGEILHWKISLNAKVMRLAATGCCLVVAAYIVNPWLPINKHLWTSSFALLMAGIDFVLFAACLFFIDGRGYRRIVQPFVIMGMNAIAVYMMSELLEIFISTVKAPGSAGGDSIRSWTFDRLFAHLGSPANSALLYALAYTLLMYVFAYALYRKRWFVRV